MKLGTLRSTNKLNRDGSLVVVSQNNARMLRVDPEISLRQALENWSEWHTRLSSLSHRLKNNEKEGVPVRLQDFLAPLPNAPGFYDGSAFLSHVRRARKVRGDEMPESARKTPLMYQGVSDNNLSWSNPIDLMNPEFGGDFEGEFAVITTDVPKAVSSREAEKFMVLLTLFNDITYREIVKTEIETKFGFLQSKPNSAYAPFAITLDEVKSFWKSSRLELDLEVKLNGGVFGSPNGREMHFSFADLVAHATRTRPLSAGSIVGSGTISNEDPAQGFACLTEKRFQEILDTGSPKTPWLKAGDVVEMDVRMGEASVFGPIQQKATLATGF